MKADYTDSPPHGASIPLLWTSNRDGGYVPSSRHTTLPKFPSLARAWWRLATSRDAHPVAAAPLASIMWAPCVHTAHSHAQLNQHACQREPCVDPHLQIERILVLIGAIRHTRLTSHVGLAPMQPSSDYACVRGPPPPVLASYAGLVVGWAEACTRYRAPPSSA